MTAPEPSGASPRTPFLSPGLAQVLTRDKFRFSPNGMTAVCIAGDGQGGQYLETWSFTEPSPRWWPLPLAEAVTPHTQPIPLDDGRVMLWRQRPQADTPNGSHAAWKDIVLPDQCMILMLEQIEDPPPERVLGVIQSDGLVGLRLLPAPGPDPVAVAIAIDNRGHSTIWQLAAYPPHLRQLAQIPSLLLGGAWLDRAGTFLGVDRAEGDGPAKTVAVNLQDGSWTPLLSVSKTSNDRLLGCAPGSGLLLVSTDAPGEERLGWAKLGSGQPVRFPDTLHRPDHTTHPLTFDPHGQRVLLQLDEGVCSRLAVYTPASDHLTPVNIPAGCIPRAACWTGDLIRFPFSTPSEPPGVATVRIADEGAACWSVAGSVPAAGGVPWAHAHIEQLDGAAGPIEAIVYGGQHWRTSSHLLVALHGGPVDAWRFEFNPLLQHLAAAGIAIVALNPRGSSGYGSAHTLAIRGAWGGPDLDDVGHIALALADHRRALGAPGPMLFGVSYGAFLALLAASCEPDLWSRCVAIAPFLSGPQLYREAPAVQGLIEQLGGLQEAHDESGPRDVLRLCHALRARLLIIHGDRDDRIPVGQSRALRQRLLALGRREGADFTYLEIPGGGHDLATGAHTQTLREQLVRFLTAGPLDNARAATAWPDR